MFNLFRRDPAREKLKIPVHLFGVTLAAAANASNILNGAGLKGKFSRQAIFAEVCGCHVNIAISTMARVDDYLGPVWSYDKGERFLSENLPGVLNRLKDPKVLNRFKADHFTSSDLALIEELLIAEKTFSLAASYYSRSGLNVSDEDVLNFGRKYNPKLLTMSREDRSNSAWAYIIRCVRISHLEDIQSKEFMTSYLIRFNDTLFEAVLDLEANVERLMPKSP